MLGVARTEAVASAPQDSYLQVKAVPSRIWFRSFSEDVCITFSRAPPSRALAFLKRK